MPETATLPINQHHYLELEKIALGAFHPLKGFMTQAEFRSVTDRMRLPDGAVFPIPVVLDVTAEQARALQAARRVALMYQEEEVGELTPEDFYRPDKLADAKKIFGTTERAHAGVARFLRMGEVFVGGCVRLRRRARFEFSEYELTPQETCAHFTQKGWRSIVGFQTRNVPHRAHEYLLRLALESADGVFIQPLVGFKKPGDYTPRAILTAYRALIDRFLPKERVLLGVLSTAMRYAGPREAVFHAIIRRNYGCTHFIVGRDHAGVGGYYEKYAAHELARRYQDELGIQILCFAGPFYCAVCGGIVTERTCPHERQDPKAVQHISGSEVRRGLSNGHQALEQFIRPEVLEAVRGIPLFVEEHLDEPR